MTTLYLVDDHQMFRESIRFALEAAGYRVLGESDNPIQALADVARLEPELILLELQLNGYSGLDVLERLARRGIKTRILILTVSAQMRDLSAALRLGAAGYVLKTAKLAELLEALAQVSKGKRYLSPEVSGLAARAIREDRVTTTDTIETLSPRERQIIAMVVGGQSSAEIGTALCLSARTVDTYRSRLMAKIGVKNSYALVRFALLKGWVDVNESDLLKDAK